MSLLKPIHHTFAPHVDLRFCLKRTGVAITPWRWKRGRGQDLLTQELSERFRADAFLFASGREALCALLRAMKLQPGEEVIIQGYTCVAVPNAIHAAGGVPVFADIDPQTLNVDPEEVRRAMTSRTRAVICQHTFAIPGPVEKLKQICTEHSVMLIEDCAHVLPDAEGPRQIAQQGDYAFFSFGRDKAATGVVGGAVISRHPETSQGLEEEVRRTRDIGFATILRFLLYPCIYFIARPFYGIGLGKAFLLLMKKLRILVPVVTTQEKCGYMSPVLQRMPNACALLTHYQLSRHKRINDHRRKLTKLYLEAGHRGGWKFPHAITAELPMQKFPLFIPNPEELRRKLKHHNIHLHDGWTRAVICPYSVDQSAMNYQPGSCPNAEEVAKKVLTLPTHPTMTVRQAKELIEILKDTLQIDN